MIFERELVKQIAKLKRENAELKAKNKWYSEQVCNKECAEVWGNLTKAKELLELFVQWNYGCCKEPDYKNLVKQAEQFLKE